MLAFVNILDVNINISIRAGATPAALLCSDVDDFRARTSYDVKMFGGFLSNILPLLKVVVPNNQTSRIYEAMC